MKKLILMVLVCMVLVSCATDESLRKNIDQLKVEKSILNEEINQLEGQISIAENHLNSIKGKSKSLTEDNRYKEAVINNDPIKYVVQFELKQSHISLDIGKHLKDELNKIVFAMPVDKAYYDSLEIGSDVIDEFRMGSLLLESSFGSWKMKVVSKQIIVE